MASTALQVSRPLAWPLYFAEVDYEQSDRRAVLLNILHDFFLTDTGSQFLKAARPSISSNEVDLDVDFASLRRACHSPDLVAAMELQPHEALECLGAAAYQV